MKPLSSRLLTYFRRCNIALLTPKPSQNLYWNLWRILISSMWSIKCLATTISRIFVTHEATEMVVSSSKDLGTAHFAIGVAHTSLRSKGTKPSSALARNILCNSGRTIGNPAIRLMEIPSGPIALDLIDKIARRISEISKAESPIGVSTEELWDYQLIFTKWSCKGGRSSSKSA